MVVTVVTDMPFCPAAALYILNCRAITFTVSRLDLWLLQLVNIALVLEINVPFDPGIMAVLWRGEF
jgi:hypothetical protein